MDPKLGWITGAHGLIGNYIVQTAARFASTWRVRGVTREQFDLLDGEAVRRELQKDRPQLIIHCAAISSVVQAQANPDLARRVNVEATRVLAELAADIQFIFLSTDLVFDGRRGNYAEADAPNPLHVYGETKAAAEQIVLKNPGHTVVRLSLVGGISRSGNRGFNEQLRQSAASGQTMRLFTDEFRSPLPASEAARAIWELAAQKSGGLFHVAGADRLSRWEIGRILARRFPEWRTNMEPALAREFPGPPRALDTSLNIARAQERLSSPLPGLAPWLAAHPNEPF